MEITSSLYGGRSDALARAFRDPSVLKSTVPLEVFSTLFPSFSHDVHCDCININYSIVSLSVITVHVSTALSREFG